jgi:Cu+-exporting ATPase
LKHVPGVREANVNFASEKARVKYDPRNTNPEILSKTIMNAGYEASEVSAPQNEYNTEHTKRRSELKKWKIRVTTAGILSFPMALFMVFDFVRIPKYEVFIMPYMAIASLILATLVLFFTGRQYFSGAWSALRMKTTNMYSLIAIGTLTAYLYSIYSYVVYFIQTGSVIGVNGMKVP